MFASFESEEEKKSIISLLLQLAATDMDISPTEVQFIFKVAENMGLEEGKLQEVLQDPGKHPFRPPIAEKERMTVLYYLLFLMRVDRRITGQEERLLSKAAFRLGFHQELAIELIEVMKEYLNDRIPPNLMLEKVKKYMN